MGYQDSFPLGVNGWLEHPNCFQDEENVVVGYISEATEELGLLGMTYLFLKSYNNNKFLNITGLLCYDGSHYGMIIEGEMNNVQRLCRTIEHDMRHRILYKSDVLPIHSKHFDKWTMKFKGAESIARALPGYSDSLDEIGHQKAASIKQLIRLYDA